MTAAEALRDAALRLKRAEVADPARDARRLLAHALGLAPDRVTLHLNDQIGSASLEVFFAAVARREAHQPVSQITGTRAFYGHSFKVTQDTLDPRPDTEILVTTALEQPFARLLDLGTGTGCILLSCLAAMPQAVGTGSDLSPDALAIAKENAGALGLVARTCFVVSDWFTEISGRFDLIVANPPYISEAEMADLSPDVREWEPRLALTPGGDGLDAYRAIVQSAGAYLSPGGRLAFEIGPTQAGDVCALLHAAGFAEPQIRHDLDGRDRVLVAVWPGESGRSTAV
ncbi:MAG: peptide chain release factor N(5)-glutamine methyltransferase [Albidovulum sp.]